MNKLLFSCCALLILSASSCRKDPEPKPVPVSPEAEKVVVELGYSRVSTEFPEHNTARCVYARCGYNASKHLSEIVYQDPDGRETRRESYVYTADSIIQTELVGQKTSRRGYAVDKDGLIRYDKELRIRQKDGKPIRSVTECRWDYSRGCLQSLDRYRDTDLDDGKDGFRDKFNLVWDEKSLQRVVYGTIGTWVFTYSGRVKNPGLWGFLCKDVFSYIGLGHTYHLFQNYIMKSSGSEPEYLPEEVLYYEGDRATGEPTSRIELKYSWEGDDTLVLDYTSVSENNKNEIHKVTEKFYFTFGYR